MARALVRCDGARAPARAIGAQWDVELTLAYRGPAANQSLRLQDLSVSLGANVDQQAMDLLRIASYAYWADQMVSRGGKKDVYGKDWRREFLICAPVSDPDFWNQNEINERLSAALDFVSEDVWSFDFTKAHLQDQLALDTDTGAPRFNPDSVALFSGGADSLCALVEAVTKHGRKPLVVSHRPAPNIDHQQRAVLTALRQRLRRWKFPPAGVIVNRVKSPEHENSQRTRSFLYASIGAAIASALGLDDVLLADNGIVSLNLPITSQLLGAMASRSTHPKFIWRFNQLAKAVLPGSPQLVNPLLSRTKAECLEVLKTNGLSELLQETRSCSRSRGLYEAKPHCGVCSQCVERRFSSITAQLEEHDLAERYRTDVFCDPLEDDARTTAESYVRFAQGIDGLSEDDLFNLYPQLNDAILPDDPDPARTAGVLTMLLSRHAAATIEVVKDQLERHKAELAKRQLPATCLLYLAIKMPYEVESKRETVKTVELTSEDESVIERQHFRSRLGIHITGDPVGQTSNLIRVEEAKVTLYDEHLRYFLRLVLGLYESDEGYVPFESMGRGLRPVQEYLLFDEDPHHLNYRLRASFRAALGELSDKEFIEVGRKKVRLSTHRKLVTWNQEGMLGHRDEKVRELFKQLLETAASLAEAPAPV